MLKSAHSGKRNRVPTSCTECHRRKQKCDRQVPCFDCKERGVPLKCKYRTPPKANRDLSDGVRAFDSRLRRIMTGEEIILSAESVDALTNPWETGMMQLLADSGYSTPTRSPNQRWTENDNLQTMIKRLSSPNTASGLHYRLPIGVLDSFDPFTSLPETPGEPIPKHVLIRYYIERLAPWFTYLDDEFNQTTPTPSTPRLAWFHFAMQHPPFFYATLLTAAVHLNRRRKIKDAGALLWYKTETIKRVNEWIEKGQVEGGMVGISDEMIMTGLILLVFNVGGNNPEEFQIHLNGINQMIKLRGGIENLGMRGMVRNWLGVCYGPWREG